MTVSHKEGRANGSGIKVRSFPHFIILVAILVSFAASGWAAGTVDNPTNTQTTSQNILHSKSPQTLTELLALKPEELEKIDIARMNLLCGEGLHGAENLDVQQNLDTLDNWTRQVEYETTRNYHRFVEHPEEYDNSEAYYRMMMLATVLQEDFQAHYVPERAIPQLLGKHEPDDVFFADAADVFINGILGDKRQGTCSSLPVLYAAVAQRLGYPVDLASTKEHLYLRYEEGTNHLNVDAAGEGFITHPDPEYRKWPHHITDEEIKTYGYLKPMSKQEILGAFLTIRASCLTSMKKFDDAAQSWEAASHYLPPTAALNRIVTFAKERASDVHKADRWDELWDAVVTQPIPDDALDYFQNRQAQILLFMNRSTDLAAIEKAASNLKSEVAEYAKARDAEPDIIQTHNSDEYPQQVGSRIHKTRFRISFVPPPVRLLQISEPDQSLASALFPQEQRMIFPAEFVPLEYWQSIPPELMDHLRKLGNEREMIEEMNAFAMEEASLRNLKTQDAMSQTQFQPPPTPFGQNPEINIRPEDLPEPWRGRPIPLELKDRLASLNQQNAPQMRIKQAIDDYFSEQDQQQMRIEAIQTRRHVLDQQPAIRPLFQIEIVPAIPEPTGSNLPLTIQPQARINRSTNAKGRQ